MKKEKKIDLISELQLIRNKMGLNSGNINYNAILSESKILLYEGTGKISPDDAARALSEWLGLTAVKNTEDIGKLLQKNPIDLNLPKVGGGFEVSTIRTIDELVAFASKAENFYPNTEISKALKNVFQNTPGLRQNVGKALLSSDVDNTIIRYNISRNSTKAASKSTSTVVPIQTIYNNISQEVDGQLRIIDDIMGRTNTSTTADELLPADFATGSGYKLTEDLVGGPEKSFIDFMSDIDTKIKALESEKLAHTTFVDNVRKLIQNSGIPDAQKASLISDSGYLGKINKQGEASIQGAIDDLNKIKKNAADLNLQKGQAAEEKLIRDPEAENMYKPDEKFGVTDVSKIVFGVLGITTKITAKALYILNSLADATVGEGLRKLGTRMGTEKGFGKKLANYKPDALKRVAERYKRIHTMSVAWFDDIIMLAKKNNNGFTKATAKSWWIDLWNSVAKGEGTSVNTFDETRLISKGIISEMMELTRKYKGKNWFAQKGVYETEMKRLFNDLESTFRNTTNKRLFTQDGATQITKLEDLAKEFEGLIDEMVEGKIEGAAELKAFWKESTAADGEVNTFIELSKWLDDAALKRGYGKTDGTFGTLGFVWEDFFFFGSWLGKNIKKVADTPFSVVQREAQEKFAVKGADSKAATDNIVNKAEIPQETKNVIKAFLAEFQVTKKITNLMTYGHYMNADELQRLFAVYGPFKGMLVVGTREVVTHTVVIGLIDLLLETAMQIDGMIGFDSDDNERKYSGTYTVIDALEYIGDKTDSDRFRLMASELKDRVNADYWDYMYEEVLNNLTNGEEYFVKPMFIQNASWAEVMMRAVGTSEETIEAYLESEYSMYSSTVGEFLGDAIEWCHNYRRKRSVKYGEEGRKNLVQKLDADINRITNTGYIYRGLSNTAVAEEYKKKESNNISEQVDNLSNTGNIYGYEMGMPNWLNDTYTDSQGNNGIIKNGLFGVLDYPDEPKSTYTFQDGTTYDFSYNLEKGGFSQHQKAAEKWWGETKNKIGIMDAVNNTYYTIYPRNHFTNDEINSLISEDKIVLANKGTVAQTSSGSVLIFNPKDSKYYDFALLDQVIPKEKLITLINTDNRKRRLARATEEFNKENKKIEENEGKSLANLIYNKDLLDKKIEEYINQGYDEKTSTYYPTYVRAYKLRYGTKNKNGKYVKWYDPIDQVEVTYIDYDEQIKKAWTLYNTEKNKINKKHNDTVNGSSKIPTNESKNYSKIINEFLSIKNLKQTNMRNVKSQLFESKRFDEDDYKHWKDTFTFQSVDEKNPGQYKDVKLNMDDVMDRIPHYRKKYDEDDSFVRAVVDTHENVVRFMFTKDLANIREGYSAVGFAKILQQIRESRGEMEIWSVARPASGNWFLVKGDFTPKELMGMDLEKNEPSDKQPKKRENSLETLKKKELTSSNSLKNDEKSGFNELPKIVKKKLRDKFNFGWTTEEPNQDLMSYYDESEVKSVFGDDIKIYKLNANEEFFDYISQYSDSLPIKRGFCRSIQLSKNEIELTKKQKEKVRYVLNLCQNKFKDNLGLSINSR
jgi:hypothetical protein